MKNNCLLLFLMLCTMSVFAQLPNGAEAPDFSVLLIGKDSLNAPPEGVFTLSDETNAGRGVCLFFGATWCSPCWTFKSNRVLDTIYNLYGPNGSNDANVLFIEADTMTNKACLFDSLGCSFGIPRGDWTDVPYGITDLAENNEPDLAEEYEVELYPGLYVISPDMRAFQITRRTLAVYESWLLESFKLSVIPTIEPAGCGGEGAVLLFVQGGHGILNYEWSNGETTKDLININGGSYSVTITDENGYDKAFGPYFVPGADTTLNIELVEKQNIVCFGDENGILEVTGDGGNPPFAYVWSTGDSTAAISGLSAGDYSVTITDDEGCVADSTFSITVPDTLEVNALAFPEFCEMENGIIEIYPSGGIFPYMYSIGDTLGPDSIFSNLVGGTYAILVVDSNGCEAMDTVIVNSIPSPTADAGEDMAIGCGVDSVTLNGTGSSQGPNFTYLWTTRDGNIIRGDTTLTPDVNGLGEYTLFVTDMQTGCVTSDEVDVLGGIISNAGPTKFLTCDSTQVHLDGTASSQGPNIVYAWTATNGGVILSGENSLTPLAGATGTYTLIVTDTTLLCADTSSVEVEENTTLPTIDITPPDTLTCVVRQVDINALGSSSGPQFSYKWTTRDGHIVSGDTSLLIEVDTVGTYVLTIKNSINGCENSDSVEVIEFINTPAADFSTVPNNLMVSFEDESSGNPTSWTWDFGDGNSSSEQNPDHSYDQIGTYTVCLRIENECDADSICKVVEVVINQPLILSSFSIENVSCNGGSDGAIDIAVSGGIPPYEFNWSNGNTEEDLTDVPAGNYRLTVTDAASGSIMRSFDVRQPSKVELASEDIRDETDNGNDGYVSITIRGGVPPYTYAWSNGGSESTITGLAAGDYTCTVTDDNGCVTEFGPFTVKKATAVRSIEGLELFNSFPNPASDQLSVQLAFSYPANRSIDLIDIRGNILARWDVPGLSFNVTVSLRDIAPGSYFLRVEDGSGSVVKKVIIQR
jgi:PKD repeat protein